MSDMAFLCATPSTGAGTEVQAHFQQLDALAAKYELRTDALVAQIIGFQLPNFAFTVDIPNVLNYALVGPGSLPAFDAIGDPAHAMGLPPDASSLPYSDPGIITLPVAPSAPAIPNPNFGGLIPPIGYTPQFQPAPILADVVNPVFGDRTSAIPKPILRPIDPLPPVPVIDWDAIDLTYTPPVFTAQPPDARDYAWSPDAYNVQILGDVKPVIESMLQGGTGIPAAVENAIWQRDADRESQLARRAEMEVGNGWAAKGWTVQQGPLNAALARVRQDAVDKQISLSRDVMIAKFKELVQIIQFAVTQGLAYENLFVGLYTAIQQLRMESAKFAVQIALSVFDAQVKVFDVEARLVELQFQAKREIIQLNLGKLQGYRDQLEAKRIEGTLNQQDIDLYKSALEAVRIDAEIYTSEVNAAKLVLEENGQRIQNARLLIDEETAKLSAVETQARIYTAEVNAEVSKTQAWAARAAIFTDEMNGWRTQAQVFIENGRFVLAKNSDITQRFQATVAGFNAKAEAIRAVAELIISNNNSKTQAYTAQTQGTSAFNSALVGQMNGLMQIINSRVELAIKNGEINVQNSLEGERIKEQLLTTAVQVFSQIYSSAMSGHSTHAQIGDSSNFSYGCNYQTTQDVST